MKKNPYSLVFGKNPNQLISRPVQSNLILDTFFDDEPSQQVFMITGLRGAGKTVFMTDISKTIEKQPDWIVVNLSPENNLLESLASKLSSENSLAKLFKSAKINLSFFGFGLEVSGVAPITDIETAITKMLESIKKQGKRVLVTIDEVVSTDTMRKFASAFQIFVRQDLPIFLLMTGLYENISELQNEKTLTFLYRATKIDLKPLNIKNIASNYKKTLGVSEELSLKIAKLTKGYPFAFQVLGYFMWNSDGKLNDILDEYSQYLEEYVYEKIWSELSNKDREIAYGIAMTETGKISDIRAFLKLNTNEFNPYRKRLIKRGIINGDVRGYVTFTLPLFEEFVKESYEG